ncbi:MAG TPA: hypothetical protein PK971_03250, partial [Saprospiraceae bacterium]|nr:hypothetical protein [Saprospiraceae bacterium]
TVRDALENVSPEALLEFVREYARRDRDFSLALKTYFASTITDADNPYALVLDTAISKRVASQSSRDPDFRRLVKTLDDLTGQMAEAATQQHYRTLYLIASALLQKLGPVYEKVTEAKRDALGQYLLKTFERLCELHDSAAPPELREAAWMLLLDWGLSAGLSTDFSRQAIRYLSRSAGQEAHFEAIRLRFDQMPHPAPPALLLLFLAALSVRKMPQAVVRVLEDYIAHPALLHASLLDLYYLHHSESVLLAGDRFVPAAHEGSRPLPDFSPAQRRELEDILLCLAEKSGDRERQVERLRQRLRQNAPLEVFQRLKALLQDEWPAELQRISSELRQSTDRSKLATLLAADGAAAALADWLRDDRDFALYQRHEPLLLGWDKAAVRQRYVDFLSGFLSEHFGLPASAQVRLYLQSLMRRQELGLVREIVQALVEAFPDRLTLSAELMELFPKRY